MTYYTILAILVLGLFTSAQTAEVPATGHKLEGIFTTKIPSLTQLSLDEYHEGDVAFFSGNLIVSRFESDGPADPANRVFLDQLQSKGVACFYISARHTYRREECETSFRHSGLQFSSLVKDQVTLADGSVLANGVVYVDNGFYPNLQINGVLTHLAAQRINFKRVFYFCDDTDHLYDLIDKVIHQPMTVYFVCQKPKLYPSRSDCRFLLSDQPSAHWAFTMTPKQQREVIRQNPLILAETFVQPPERAITYENILEYKVLRKAFQTQEDKPLVVEEQPRRLLFETFVLAGGHYVDFARFLKPLYDPVLWTHVMPNLTVLRDQSDTGSCYEAIIEGLVEAQTPDLMKIYADQIVALFQNVKAKHLRESAVRSLNGITPACRAQKLATVEAAVTTELSRACLLALFSRLPPGEYEMCLDEICQKIPRGESPFKFVKNLRESLDPVTLGLALKYFHKFEADPFKWAVKSLAKAKLQPERVIPIFEAFPHVTAQMGLDNQQACNFFTTLVSLNPDREKIHPLLKCFQELLGGIKELGYGCIGTSLQLLSDCPDEDARHVSVRSARKIYNTLSHNTEYLLEILKRLIRMPSNDVRQEAALDTVIFMKRHLFPAIERIEDARRRKLLPLSLGHPVDFEWGIYSILDLSVPHRDFFSSLMQCFKGEELMLYGYGSIGQLTRDIATIPVEKHAGLLEKVRPLKFETYWDLREALKEGRPPSF